MSAHQKVAVVTGAARGIGLAIAKKFLEQGYAVALLDIDANELVRVDSTLGDRTVAIVCDVSDPSQVRAAVGEVEARFGRIDALVNNAGIAVFKPLLETTHEEWERVRAGHAEEPGRQHRQYRLDLGPAR
jgi:NAD(P)-dependent dehydrogenase (short-subunit alcohol dehydrogenase family)